MYMRSRSITAGRLLANASALTAKSQVKAPRAARSPGRPVTLTSPAVS